MNKINNSLTIILLILFILMAGNSKALQVYSIHTLINGVK